METKEVPVVMRLYNADTAGNPATEIFYTRVFENNDGKLMNSDSSMLAERNKELMDGQGLTIMNSIVAELKNPTESNRVKKLVDKDSVMVYNKLTDSFSVISKQEFKQIKEI